MTSSLERCLDDECIWRKSINHEFFQSVVWLLLFIVRWCWPFDVDVDRLFVDESVTWTRRGFECFFKVSLLPRGSSSPEVAIREVFTRIESVFAPRAALFMRTESIRHPQTSIEIESCWYQSVFDSKASFAYLTEGKRNPSPLPSLHSHSNLTHLVTRVRINFYLSFQTFKSVQRSDLVNDQSYLPV